MIFFELTSWPVNKFSRFSMQTLKELEQIFRLWDHMADTSEVMVLISCLI